MDKSGNTSLSPEVAHGRAPPIFLAGKVRMALALRGRFDCKIDPKGRLSLPTAFRRLTSSNSSSKKGDGPSYVITNSLYQGRRCLDVYPLKEWEKLEAKIAKMPSLKKEVQAYQRFYLASGQAVQADGQNRLLVPSSLRKYAELDEEVVLVGMGKKFEIWPLSAWTDLYEGLATNYEDILTAVADLEEKL